MAADSTTATSACSPASASAPGEGGLEKNETPHPLPDKGLRRQDNWRGRRVVLETENSSPRELPDEILRAFRDWCASPGNAGDVRRLHGGVDAELITQERALGN